MDTGYPALITEPDGPDIPETKRKEKRKTENPQDENLSDQDPQTISKSQILGFWGKISDSNRLAW